ncbi:MAG: hypothetical protein ACR2RA_00805 [Geminicoccaceae bacterium]
MPADGVFAAVTINHPMIVVATLVEVKPIRCRRSIAGKQPVAPFSPIMSSPQLGDTPIPALPLQMQKWHGYSLEQS